MRVPVLILAAALTLSGCALGGRVGPNADAARMREAGAEPGQAWDRGAPDVYAYLADTAEADLYELQAAQVARERSGNRHVRAYARRMIRQHQRAGERAGERAAAAGLTPPAAPPVLDEAHSLMILQLQTAADVDRAYIAQQRRSHHRQWVRHTSYLRQGDVPQVRREAGWQRKYALRHIRQLDRLERRVIRP